ncbi:MAG: hypothetical protein OHK0015_18640 [Chloroflexi bacterium OHK40]
MSRPSPNWPHRFPQCYVWPARSCYLCLAAWLLLLAACAPSPAAAPTPATPRQPVAGGPTLLRDDITLRRVGTAGAGSIRLARSPIDGTVYVLNGGRGLLRLDLERGATAPVASVAEITGGAAPTGMAFGPDGALYVVGNQVRGTTNTAVVRRGTPTDAGFTWATLAETEPYPLSGTQFDHLFNGVVVSPDGAWVYVNSGSRTDHGEVQTNGGAFPEAREVPLTAAIFRLPAGGSGLTLPNDAAALEAAGYVMARGTRNAYDLAFAPNGELFAVDNGPDADLPDELNWIREGLHYGFPWRFGTTDNPQQFPGYNPAEDRRLHPDFFAVSAGLYRDDPTFPPAPAAMADPVANRGPAAAIYRGDDGSERDAAAEGEPLHTFTPHRSPLGLLFVDDAALPADLRGRPEALSALVLSWGAAGGTLSDTGQDLLHLTLTRRGENYEARTTRIAHGFGHPIDALLIDNRLYVLEFDGESVIWELRFG